MTNAQNEKLLEMLWACAASCEYCADKCQERSTGKTVLDCVRQCRDCTDFCVLTARFITRQSQQAQSVLRICMEMCLACAHTCSGKQTTYEKDCEQACLACAEACREVLD